MVIAMAVVVAAAKASLILRACNKVFGGSARTFLL
jgi:hypothetical protein